MYNDIANSPKSGAPYQHFKKRSYQATIWPRAVP